jgi:hypothetical protein
VSSAGQLFVQGRPEAAQQGSVPSAPGGAEDDTGDGPALVLI